MRKKRLKTNEWRDNVCGKFVSRDESNAAINADEKHEPLDGGAIPPEPCACRERPVSAIERMFGKYWWLTAIVVLYLLYRKK